MILQNFASGKDKWLAPGMQEDDLSAPAPGHCAGIAERLSASRLLGAARKFWLRSLGLADGMTGLRILPGVLVRISS